jgi:NAD(P)H-hydrate epimerase
VSELILNREQSRRVDVLAVERYGMTGLVLMENAGRGAAEIIRRIYQTEARGTEEIVICCGKGNNGGDGFVVARHLDIRQTPIRILLFCDPAKLTGDAAANYEIAHRSGLPIEVFPDESLEESRLRSGLNGIDFVVDALLGTGSKGDPRPPLDRVIPLLNQTRTRRIALDIPSGLDCDTGTPAAATFQAHDTITFVARKTGFAAAAAKPYTGQVHVVDIGVPRVLLEQLTSEPELS